MGSKSQKNNALCRASNFSKITSSQRVIALKPMKATLLKAELQIADWLYSQMLAVNIPS
jgi:hypothetical protein